MLRYGRQQIAWKRSPDQCSGRWMARNALTVVDDFLRTVEKHGQKKRASWVVMDASTLPYNKALIDTCLRFVWYCIPGKRRIVEDGMMKLADYQDNVKKVPRAEKARVIRMIRKLRRSNNQSTDDMDGSADASADFHGGLTHLEPLMLNAELQKGVYYRDILEMRAAKVD